MDSVKVSSEKLSDEVKKSLTEYRKLSVDVLKETIDEVSQEAVNVAKDAAPVDSGTKRKGKYKKSLKADTEFEDSHSKRKKIWASGHEYSLSHLLEKGHDLVGHRGSAKGKRIGSTGKFPHFDQAEKYVEENFEDTLKKKMEG